MTEKSVTKRDTSIMTQSQAMYLLKTIWKDAPETEIIKAGILCRQYNLNPLMGHIFLIKYDRYAGKGTERRKVGEDWVIVRGIKAKRTMAQAKHRYSYADGPRVMAEDEQIRIFGEVEKDKIWAIVLLKDQNGNVYPGYGFWPRESGVYGSEKGNSPRNMAFIRAEANALDKLEPGELPGIDVADDNFIVGDFQAALEEGKQRLIENAEQDVEDLWPHEGDPIGKVARKKMKEVKEVEAEPTAGPTQGAAETSPDAPESITEPVEKEMNGRLPVEQGEPGTFTVDDLYAALIAAKPALKNIETAKNFLMVKLQIAKSLIEQEPVKVWERVRQML